MRDTCRAVADQARQLRINVEAIAPYAAGLPAAADVPGLNPEAHFTEGDAEAVAAVALCMDAINFVIWNRGQQPRIKALPRLVRCTAY